MCGIAGIIGIEDKKIIKKMCDTIVHRGPDDEGFYYDSNIMMGMRRLKVIDLDTGSQPIYNEDKSIVVVYNGEIYNFREIRKSLTEKGHKFYTKSDTETIIHLYEDLGEECVEKLRGMFSFAIWDSNKKKLVIARDRLGIKSLYYYFKNGILIFGSELKVLLQCEQINKEINFTALHDYLTFMCVPSPNTIFNNIYKLDPGNILIYEKNNVTLKKYWDASKYLNTSINQNNNKNIEEQLYFLMKESVQSHMVSDVPLGVFLSGGLDSSSIVAIASEYSSEKLKTFSIGFEDEFHNELDNAKLIAKKYNTNHHEFVVKPSSLDEIFNVLHFFDEPFADSSAIPTYFVSKCAREKVTVALSGDGGDELFGGYGNYKADKIAMNLRKIPLWMRYGLLSGLSIIKPNSENNLSWDAQIRKLFQLTDFSPEFSHVYWLSCFSENAKNEMYNSDKLKQFKNINSINKYADLFNYNKSSDFINKFICIDIKTILQNDYLVKVDRMSMANSLEVRVPFLDHKLVEFSLSIDSKYKLKGLNTKYLLKKIMRDKLPKEILSGRKKGFSIPLTRWFREDFTVLFNEFLSKDTIIKRGYFNYEFINKMINEHINKKKDNSKLLWTLICFEIWHRNYMD